MDEPDWCFGGGAAFAGEPALTDEGGLFLTTYEGHVHALTPSGGYRYSYTLEGQITGGPAWWRDRLYVPTASGRVYALRNDGSLFWIARVPLAPVTGLAVDAHGTAYFVATDGRLYALSRWGTLKFSLSVPELPVASLTVVGDGRVLIETAGDGLFLLGSGRVEALGRASVFALSSEGTLRGVLDGRFSAFGGPGVSAPTELGDAVAMSAAGQGWVVVTERGEIVWLDAAGRTTARQPTNLGGLRSVASDGKVVYVADDERGLWALEASGGSERPLARPNGPVQALLADPARGRLLLMTADRLCSYPTAADPSSLGGP